ncbi:MAG: hypothetical protein DRR19_33455 [Candidatus Parabeggiatoa sp. nov. 1]|nr:MAG: hypothetical protein DRR19_33455 [Gammaproteobacteria bacterium]
MTTKEIVFTSIVALIIGIILVHYEDFINTPPQSNDLPPQPPSVSPTPNVDETTPLPSIVTPPPETVTNQPNPIITQLKELLIPEAAVTVAFWLDAPDKTQFSTQHRVTLYYQIKESAFANGNQREFYFTLFNISPTGKLSILLTNEAIEANKLYALPKPRTDWQPEQFSRQDKRLRLEAGREYFKAIVTTEPIASWLKLLATDMMEQLQRDKLLGTKEMWINVD